MRLELRVPPDVCRALFGTSGDLHNLFMDRQLMGQGWLVSPTAAHSPAAALHACVVCFAPCCVIPVSREQLPPLEPPSSAGGIRCSGLFSSSCKASLCLEIIYYPGLKRITACYDIKLEAELSPSDDKPSAT